MAAASLYMEAPIYERHYLEAGIHHEPLAPTVYALALP